VVHRISFRNILKEPTRNNRMRTVGKVRNLGWKSRNWILHLIVLNAVISVLDDIRGPPVFTVSAQTFRPNQPPSFVSGGDLSRFSIPEDTPVGSVIYRWVLD
jgi:hypothetical protein